MASVIVALQTNRQLRQRFAPLHYWLLAFGIDLPKFIRALQGFSSVVNAYRVLKRQHRDLGSKQPLRFVRPCLTDRDSASGTIAGHYFYQDLLVARKIFLRRPLKHVDVGSRIDGFVAQVSIFKPIEVFDIRPLNVQIPNVVFTQCDVMSPNRSLMDYCDSISCLHALEHFGLGRYGDPVDIGGHLRGFDNLYWILQSRGILYLSIPIGPERIDFNGHRVFSIGTILEMAKGRFELLGFSYIDDRGDLHEDVDLDAANTAKNCDCHYGCGIFEFKKVG